MNAIAIPMQRAKKKRTVDGLLPMNFDEDDDEKLDDVLDAVSWVGVDEDDV